MYLSKLTVDPHHVQAQTDLAAPYELHRTLAHAFVDAESDRHRARHGVLFRVEEATREGVPVLVQSATRPDWRRLPAGYLRRADGPKAFEPHFREGQQLRFRLVANPVRRVRPEGKKHPQRLALVHPHPKEGIAAGYVDWLHRQAAEMGATVADVLDAPFRLSPRRRLGAGEIAKAHIPHFGVRFDGLLSVTDPARLLAAVQRGVGPAKAFGFGLLSLAPAPL